MIQLLYHTQKNTLKGDDTLCRYFPNVFMFSRCHGVSCAELKIPDEDVPAGGRMGAEQRQKLVQEFLRQFRRSVPRGRAEPEVGTGVPETV